MIKILKNPKIVEFKNGKFAIRYGWIFYTFQDLSLYKFTWNINCSSFYSCKGSLEKVTYVYNELFDTGKEIK